MGKGGGGSSGKVDFPDYMKDWHGIALDATGTDTVTTSITDAMNATIGSSPWTGATAFDPSAELTDIDTEVAALAAILAGISPAVDWAAIYAQATASISDSADVDGITDTVIDADVSAFSDQLDDEIVTKVLPRFEAGMRDINAVMSSSFALGKAVIEGFRDREVAKHGSALRIAAATKNADIELENEKMHNYVKAMRINASEQLLKILITRISTYDSYTKTAIEAARIKIVAQKEEVDGNLKIEEEDAKWDLTVFEYGGNFLASISGATVSAGNKGPSTAQSAIGGAMSGAAAGAMVGGPAGAVVGGLLGLAGGLL